MSVEPIVSAELVRTADEWAETIRADLGRAVEGIVAAGRNLIAAKADVAHGEWGPMLKQIGISDGYARKLMSVGRNEAIVNRSHGNDLPPTFRALYELSRLDTEQIDEHIESGAITPDMTIADARDLATPRSTTVIRDEDGEETGRIVDDRNQATMTDDEYSDMLADEDREQWESSHFTCWSCEKQHPLATHVETDDGPLCEPCFDVYARIDTTETGTPTAPTAVDLAPEPIQPATPAAPRRRPITDQVRDAGWDLRKSVERIERLAADDRFEPQKEKVTPQLRGHLTDAIASLQAVLDRLNNS